MTGSQIYTASFSVLPTIPVLSATPHWPRHASRIIRQVNSNGNGARAQPAFNEASNSSETVRYIKSILCAQGSQGGILDASVKTDVDSKSLDELLPPLTSSNEVDVQLYAIIAVILNLFVQSWYQRITPDNEFIGEVVQIIAHCTRGIEQRLRFVDLEELLLDELPALLIAHIDSRCCNENPTPTPS